MSTNDSESPACHGTLVLKLGYLGEHFSGFAENPGFRTVAGELRRALETFLRREVDLTCAGRTDSGVHARAQYVSLPVTREEAEAFSGRRIQRALQALTPDDISIVEVLRAQPGFSARFDATARSYVYRVVDGAPPTLLQPYAWWIRHTLDADAMGRAGQALVGSHDFSSFCKAESARDKPTVREIFAIEVRRAIELGEPVVEVFVEGSGFLHNMVRIIVGTLVDVGLGRHPAEWVASVLAAHSRSAAAQTAPARGLELSGVTYPEGLLAPWS